MKQSLHSISIVILVLFLRQSCGNNAGKEGSNNTPSQDKKDEKTVVDSREARLGEDLLKWERHQDQSLQWNEAAQKASAEWKSDTLCQYSTKRNPLAQVLDEEQSLILGLSKSEIVQFLGPPDEEDQTLRYRYDKHFTEENLYLGCLLLIQFSDDKATDVYRQCP